MITSQKYRILKCILIFYALIWITSDCQDSFFADVLHGNLSENPSALSMRESSLIKLSYRNQWPGAGNAYVTYDAMINVKVNSLSSNVYAFFNRNAQGRDILNMDNVSLGYGYRLMLNRNIDLSAGFNVSYINRSMNYSNLTFENAATISGLNDENEFFFDYSIGFTSLIYKQHEIGFAIRHITEPTYQNSYTGTDRLYRKYILSYAVEIGMGSAFDANRMTLKPAIFIFRQYPYTMTILGAQFSISPIYIGLWVHGNNFLGIGSSTILLGTSIEKIEFNYSYDINLSAKQFFSPKMGAHEVTFLYKFEYKERRKRRKAINCPKL